MALLISDANIFIDFEDGGLLEALFRLPESVGVPDLLFEDELRDQHAHLVDQGLASWWNSPLRPSLASSSWRASTAGPAGSTFPRWPRRSRRLALC